MTRIVTSFTPGVAYLHVTRRPLRSTRPSRLKSHRTAGLPLPSPPRSSASYLAFSPATGETGLTLKSASGS